MKKIPTIFIKEYGLKNKPHMLGIKHSDCTWVFRNEGVATRKFDGTCCMVSNGEYFKRRCVKKGNLIPKGFLGEQFDPNTGKTFGWVPVTKEDKWHIEAYHYGRPDGTYELVGPKIQRNIERFPSHVLLNHLYYMMYENVPRTYEGIREFMRDKDIEGIVFHHPDGRMAKIKKIDYGMDRRAK